VQAVALDLGCWSPEASVQYVKNLGPRCKNAQEAELAELAEFVGRLPLGVRLIGMLFERRVTRSLSELLDDVRREPLKSLDQVAQGLDRGVAQTFLVAFESLDERERRVLLALSASAKATRDAIVAEVSGLVLPEAQHALEQLRDWSLAEFTDISAAPWGLHDVMRLFAQAQSGYPELVDAHVGWVKKHCQRYDKPEEHAFFALGADEVAVAVRRFVAESRSDEASELHWPLFKHLTQVGRLLEAIELTERLLDVAPEGSATEAAWLGNLGNCYRTLGDIPKAIELFERSLAIDEKLGSLEGQANQLGNLGICYQTLGVIPKAIELLERSLAIDEHLGRLE
jgi:tetratricopeptide (TPR) repeat protein